MRKKLPYQRIVLPNGLVVFLVNIKYVKTFYATLYVKVGSFYEDEGNNGISHFLEHFIHQGTQNYKNFKLFAEKIEFEGMYQNATTGKLVTQYWIDSPSEKGPDTLELLYELVFLSTLPCSRVEHVRKVSLNEYSDFWSDPVNRFEEEVFGKRINGECIYKNFVLGKPQAIKSFTRNDLLNWKNRYYSPNNTILSIAGNFEQDKVMKKIEDSFGGLKANKEIREPSRPKIIYSNFLIHLQKEKFDQIRIKLSFPTFGIKEVERKRIPFLGLLRFIVGGSASSRLFKILRLDNDLVYSVTSQTLFYPFMGDFSIRFSTSKDKLLMSLYLMKRELEKVNKMGITKRELERAKNLYRRNVVSFNFETPYQIASWVVNEELGHKQILLPEDYMEMVESASIEDINRLAKDVFNFSKLNIGLMGNLDDKDVRKIEHIFRQ